MSSPVRLEFAGDADCDATGFEHSLAAHLAASTDLRPVQVRVRISRDRRGSWTAALALTADALRSTRRLTGESCLAVSEAAAFVTAVVVDPGVLARPIPNQPPASPPEPEPPAAAPPTPLVPEPEPPGPPPTELPLPAPQAAPPAHSEPATPPAKYRPGGFVRLTGGLEALGMPRVAPQLGLAGGLLGRAWRVELGAMLRRSTRVVIPDDPRAGAAIGLWTIAARGCGVLRPGPLELPLCAGLELGQASGEGFGFAGSRRDRIVWIAALLAPALAWAPRPRFALWIGAEVAVPILGGRFKISGLDAPLFEVARVSLRASAGLELRFF